MLNSVASHIFMPNITVVCMNAKFGDVILNQGRAVTSARFQYGGSDLEL